AAFEAGYSNENLNLDVAFGYNFAQIHAMAMLTELFSILTILVCTHHVMHMKKKESFFPHGEQLDSMMALGASRRVMWLLIGGICCLHMTQGAAVHMRQLIMSDTVLGDASFSFFFVLSSLSLVFV
ncbi:MAG: hypothetical protein CMI52_04800, partial [Parcubacteria group bacterium]|nr:hypothetical protein [Parcubacteria group bacterium]